MDWLRGAVGGGPGKNRDPEPEAAPSPTPVTLHIYDVSGHSAVTGANAFFRAVGTGAYHAGVEVYGQEWSFGGSTGGYCGSGVFNCDPKDCGAHQYRESKEMGDCWLTRKEVNALLKALASEWPGDSYDLLRHNCCHFCDGFTQRLGVGPCPRWLTNLAGVGAMLRSGVRLVAKGPRAIIAGEEGESRPKPAEVWPAVGDIVEIYSNSSEAWLKGKVESRDKDMVTVIYMNGATKTLPGDHKDLRPFKGRVEFRAPPAATGIQGFQPNESVARDSGERKNGYPQTIPEEEEVLKVPMLEGDPAEVYSNSMQAWCKGYVEKVRGNLLTLAYQSPNAEGAGFDWTRKTLPSENTGWRKAKHPTQNYGMTKGVDASADFEIGDAVEIYSNSRKVWCGGRVVHRRKDVATVCFQLPGAGPEEWLEKDTKLDPNCIRRVSEKELETPDTASFSSVAASGGSYSEMEKACYEREFMEATLGQGSEASLAMGLCVDHLTRSQLPRKALKEVWAVGNPENKDPVGRSQFFLCCRLVGHCQAISEDEACGCASDCCARSSWNAQHGQPCCTSCRQSGGRNHSEECDKKHKSQAKNLLQDGGVQLRALMQNEFKQGPPRRLPDFYMGRRDC